MRPFVSLTDLEAALGMIGQPDSLRQASPGDRALFYLMSSPTFGAFAFTHTISAAEEAGDRFSFGNWWENPGGLVTIPGSRLRETYWLPGERQVVRPSVARDDSPSQGWGFWAETISLEYYTTGDVRKKAQVVELRTDGIVNAKSIPTTRLQTTLLAVAQHDADVERSIFNVCDFQNVTLEDQAQIGALFPIPLYPGFPINVHDLTNLEDTDVVEIRMLGLWRFDPRHMLEGQEARG